MGYYTHYKVRALNDRMELDMAMAAKDKTLDGLIEEMLGDNPFEESCKWYSHDEDMNRFSKLYPKVVFMLEGEGEENGDMWRSYHRDGKSYTIKAKIVWDDFDPSQI